MKHRCENDLRIHHHAYDIEDRFRLHDRFIDKDRTIKEATEAMDWPICRDRDIVIRPLSHQEQTKGESCAS